MKTGRFEWIRQKIAAAAPAGGAKPLPRLRVIGDSLSVHYGPHLKTYLAGGVEWLGRDGAEAALSDLDAPAGANWGDSSMVLSALGKARPPQATGATLTLLNCGLHDIKRNRTTGELQVPLALYRENLERIAALFARTKTRWVWVNSTPVDDDRHQGMMKDFLRYDRDCIAYNAAARQIMQGRGVPIVDLYGFTKNLGGDLYSDHVHFVEPVREKQAAYLAGWLAGWLQLKGFQA